jgi:hypothetical protein
MPIHREKGGYQWGNHGKVYPTKAGAEKQAAAAHANGWAGDSGCPSLHEILPLLQRLIASRIKSRHET